jgi:hypothetical protein
LRDVGLVITLLQAIRDERRNFGGIEVIALDILDHLNIPIPQNQRHE